MTPLPGFHLYLVRHGESANNALPTPQRVSDPNLTELGQKQAQNLSLHYSDFGHIDHVLASPFRRTLQTAQPLLSAKGMRATIWTDLYEVGGCYSGYEAGGLTGATGMTGSEIRAEFPDFDVPDDIDDTGWYKSRAFETWEMAIVRAQTQAKKLRETFTDTDSVVFCFIHADFKQLLLQHLVPGEKEFHNGGISNSSITHLHFNHDTGKVIDYCNTDHLDTSEVSY